MLALTKEEVKLDHNQTKPESLKQEE